jgi:hypothetical protein
MKIAKILTMSSIVLSLGSRVLRGPALGAAAASYPLSNPWTGHPGCEVS